MSQSILIVDDAAAIHELMKVHLSDEDWVIHSAYDGRSGLDKVASLDPDLVLLDVDMPGMNGFDVCRLIKADKATAHIPVIFLTACASADEKICGLELRATDYITKPFDPGELCARIRTALRTKRLMDLIPASSTEDEFAESTTPAAHGTSLNPRLSMKQVMRARSKNPWGRLPPQGIAVAANLTVES